MARRKITAIVEFEVGEETTFDADDLLGELESAVEWIYPNAGSVYADIQQDEEVGE